MLIGALFLMMLMFMFMRVHQPVGAKITGKVQQTVALSFQERGLMQRVNVYSIGFVLLLMTATGVLPAYAELVIILIALFILAIPVRAIFTSDGVAINNVVFRPWSEFSGFQVEKRRIVLVAKPGTRPLNLSLLANHQQEIIPILRRHLPEAKAVKDTGARKRAIAG